MSLSLGSYPDFLPAFFPFGVFLGRFFSGLRLTAFVSVVSGSSAPLVFNLFCFPVSYLMHLFLYLIYLRLDVYEINHLIFICLFSMYA